MLSEAMPKPERNPQQRPSPQRFWLSWKSTTRPAGFRPVNLKPHRSIFGLAWLNLNDFELCPNRGRKMRWSTPCSKALTLGIHEISIAVDGSRYLPKKETVTISKGSSLTWKLTPNFGLLTVRSEPAGLDVKLDGKIVGKTPLENMEVDIGGHEVLVTSECHYDTGEKVNIERGVHRQVTVSLIGKQGIVDVVAEDQNGNAVKAEVFVDNERLGYTADVFKVSICSKLLRVYRQGYREFTRSISIAERTTTPVTAKLKSVSPTPTYSTPAKEPGRREKLAVLTLKATTGGFTPTYVEFLTDKIRQTIRDRLGDKYEFMSKEAILQIELGTECPASEEAGCDLEVGQQLMADLLVTARFSRKAVSSGTPSSL